MEESDPTRGNADYAVGGPCVFQLLASSSTNPDDRNGREAVTIYEMTIVCRPTDQQIEAGVHDPRKAHWTSVAKEAVLSSSQIVKADG